MLLAGTSALDLVLFAGVLFDSTINRLGATLGAALVCIGPVLATLGAAAVTGVVGSAALRLHPLPVVPMLSSC